MTRELRLTPASAVQRRRPYELVFDQFDRRQLLSANHRKHWSVEAPIKKAWRQRALIVTRSAINRGDLPKMWRARIDVYLRWPDARHRDPANYHPTAKPIVDGMVDAGLLPDDSSGYLDGPFLRVDEPGQMRIRVVVTNLGQEIDP